MSKNTKKDEDTCYYATYAKIKGKPTEKSVLTLQLGILKIRRLLKNFLFVKNIISWYQRNLIFNILLGLGQV